jgi:acid phosphatase
VSLVPRRTLAPALVALASLLVPAVAAAQSDRAALRAVNRIVVVYEENHSFDNLYGRWEGVDGLGGADRAHTRQADQAGRTFACLLQKDVNLTSPPLAPTCTGTANGTTFRSAFANAPFRIDRFIPATARTCPPSDASPPNGVRNGQGLPGGCTRDLVHRYYQEQYQLHGGRQDRYVTGSDAAGLTMGGYDTRRLPIYRYLHRRGHPRYAIADRFFQAAFGGSFLNHQWLVAAATPVWNNARDDGSAEDLHSVVDANGMPVTSPTNPLYTSPTPGAVKDNPLTASCSPGSGRGPTPNGVTCGDFAVNTIQPAFQPFAPGTARNRRLPAQRGATIGDRLTAAGVSWAWYSGGWSNANGNVDGPGWTNGHGPLAPNANSRKPCRDPRALPKAVWPHCPDDLFQFHHQPLNYFASFRPGGRQRRAHLRDEQEFLSAARASGTRCRLRRVSFIKPIGAENEHPGYASESTGSDHLVDLLRAVQRSACAERTMVVVTYDEFGGQWDHVPPPGQGTQTRGPHDAMGPGTRIPALVIAPGLRAPFVLDRRPHDTTSVLATIEHRFGVRPLTARDRRVRDLSSVFSARRAGRARGRR